MTDPIDRRDPPTEAATGRATGTDRPVGVVKRRYLLIALAVLVVDQISKWMVEAHLPEHVAHPVIPGLLNFTHVKNSGVAFGVGADLGRSGGVWVLTLLGLGALALVTVYFWRTPSTDRLLQAALALVMGGAVGNLIDRVAAGAVTDFIDFYFGSYHFHTFNIADSGISIGIGLILLDSLLAWRRGAHTEPDEETADEPGATAHETRAESEPG